MQVNLNGGLRNHFSETELGKNPPYLRMHCMGSGATGLSQEAAARPRELPLRRGTPLYYMQTPEGWTYHFLIPTGQDPTHRMFREPEAVLLLELEQAVRSKNGYVRIVRTLAALDELREQEIVNA